MVVNRRISGCTVTLVVCRGTGAARSKKRRNIATYHNIPLLMEFGISTQIHRGKPVTVDLLESIRKAGYERIELFANRPHLDFHDRPLLRAIGRWFVENALPAPSLHLPFIENVGPQQRIFISVLDPERRNREAAIDELKRALELNDHVALAYVVMHLGNPRDAFNPVAFEYAHDNYGEKDEHLWPFEGTLDWPRMIERLVLAKYEGPFVFEARGEELSKGGDVKSRLEELWYEAHNSMEEYRLKYKLNAG